MKFTLKAIAFFTGLAMFGEAANAVQLGLPQQPPNHGTSISQATEPLDLSLLAKSVTNLLQSDRHQTDSQIEFRVGSKGTETTIYLQSKMITQSGKKFRAEVAYTKPGEAAKTGNLVISDGKQVWIYRSDLRQYSVTSYQDFKDSSDWVLIGISSFVFLDFPEEDRKVVVDGNLSDKNVLGYLGLASNSELKGETRNFDGQTAYVYDYKDPKDGFTLSAFVNPETAILSQVQLAGKSDDLDILLTEKILSKTVNPTINANTFRFSPPKGTQRVKTLSISPL
ncbi:LolA family protein [Anabaena sp. CCY 9910]|uniref:LolA family protein n=1 Tax=Anabaena sp. CCY 9910 TaxID=3103870 RepID=UPI0039DF4A40